MGGIIDQLFHILEQLILPNWSDLIALVPWVFVALVLVFLVALVRSWRKAGARTRSRVPRPLAGGAPPPGCAHARTVALALCRADRRRAAALLPRAAGARCGG